MKKEQEYQTDTKKESNRFDIGTVVALILFVAIVGTLLLHLGYLGWARYIRGNNDPYTEVSVKKMMDDYDTDYTDAEKTYKWKKLRVTGVVNWIDYDGNYLILGESKHEIDTLTGDSFVMCCIKGKDQKDKAARISIGDVITVNGKCVKMNASIDPFDSFYHRYKIKTHSIDGYEDEVKTALETNEGGYIILTTDGLMESAKTNPYRARKEIKDKNIELAGKIARIDEDGKYIVLHSDGSLMMIMCSVNHDADKEKIAELSVGSTVTVSGKCTDISVIRCDISIDTITSEDDKGTGTYEEMREEFSASKDGYIRITADRLAEMLSKNQFNAKEFFSEKKVCITGRVGNKDGEGWFLYIEPKNEKAVYRIKCYTKDDVQKKQIELTEYGQEVVVYGVFHGINGFSEGTVDIEKIDKVETK